jgi:hypothetical protein
LTASTRELSAPEIRLPWDMNQLDYLHIDRERVRNDETLFFVLTSASLIESGSDMYTQVLLNYFEGSEAGQWLREHWEPEELQHGLALRRYVETVWPEFDWPATNAQFLAEYSGYCSTDQLEETRALELVARCIIEAGTAALYRAIYDYTDEPVLKQLTHFIRSDEVRHYKHFSTYFNQFNGATKHGRWPVFKAVVRRLMELRNEDSDCALRHVFQGRYPGVSVNSETFRSISAQARGLVIKNLSHNMMVKMVLHPLQLPPKVQHIVQKPCVNIIRRFMVA